MGLQLAVGYGLMVEPFRDSCVVLRDSRKPIEIQEEHKTPNRQEW